MTKNYPQLIAEARNGSHSAMTALYEATHQQVYYAIRKLVGNDEDAADLTQETYISVLTNLDRLSEPMAFPKWCRMIAVNLTRDYLKRSKPVLFSTDEEEQRILGSIPAEGEDCLPAAYAEQADLRRQVVSLIDALPEAQRMAVYLFYFEERSVAEVAAMMQVNENTIKSRLNYARSKLRELAKKNGITMAAVPVLTLLLHNDCSATSVPGSVNDAVLSAISTLDVAAGSATAGSVAAAGAAAPATAADSATATAGVATATGVGIGIKIVAIVAAVGILVGGGFGVAKLISNRSQPESEVVETRDERETETGDIAPDLSPSAQGAAAAAFTDALEQAGGWGTFIGMTRDEIVEILGTDLICAEEDLVVRYLLDAIIEFKLEDGICSCITTFSEQLPVLDGASGLAAPDLERMLTDSGIEWYKNAPAPYDMWCRSYDAKASYYTYNHDDGLQITIAYWSGGDVSYSITTFDYIFEHYGGFILDPDSVARRIDSLGGAVHLLGKTREEVEAILFRPTFVWGGNEYSCTYCSLELQFSDPSDPWGEICIRVSGEPAVLEGYLGLSNTSIEEKLNADGKLWFAGDYIEGDPRAWEYDHSGSCTIAYCVYDGNIRYNILDSFENNTDRSVSDYIVATYYPEGMDWLEPALEQANAPAYTEDELRAIYSGVSGYPGVETGRLFADLTHDGVDELIVVSSAYEDIECAYCTVYTVVDGSPVELYQDSTTTTHVAAHTLALYQEDGASYLLSYVFYLNQGAVNDHYSVFSLDDNGGPIMLREETVSGLVDESEQQMDAFERTVDAMLQSAVILMDGQRSDLYCYGGSSAPADSAVSYSCSLADGTYLIQLGSFDRGSFTLFNISDVNGGTLADAVVMSPVTLSGSEMDALTVGDVLDLSHFGSEYSTVAIESIERDGDMIVIETTYDSYRFWLEDSGWHLYYLDPNAGDYYVSGEAELFFPTGCSIMEGTITGSVSRPSIRSVEQLDNLIEVTIAGGVVTSASVYWHP